MTYKRSVFGTSGGFGHTDPVAVQLDMGPYAGRPSNMDAFGSGFFHLHGLGAVATPAYDPSGAPVPQVISAAAMPPQQEIAPADTVYPSSGLPNIQVVPHASLHTDPVTGATTVVPAPMSRGLQLVLGFLSGMFVGTFGVLALRKV